MQLGVHSEIGPPSPSTWLSALAGIQGPLGRMLGGGHSGFQTSSWQDKDCPVPAKVRAGPGSRQRPEVAHGGNG